MAEGHGHPLGPIKNSEVKSQFNYNSAGMGDLTAHIDHNRNGIDGLTGG